MHSFLDRLSMLITCFNLASSPLQSGNAIRVVQHLLTIPYPPFADPDSPVIPPVLSLHLRQYQSHLSAPLSAPIGKGRFNVKMAPFYFRQPNTVVGRVCIPDV